MRRVAVVVFPGSNCDADTLHAARAAGCEAYFLWHRERDLRQADVAVLPGGFSYGDYLRSGAIARFSPVMVAVAEHARAGGQVLGICNGFQILCEAGLLPGALMRNAGLRFLSRPVWVRVEASDTPFTCLYERGEVLELPIAHGDGRYAADPPTVAELEAGGQVVWRYVRDNPNGSTNDIAGICNPGRNVVGIMPHPDPNPLSPGARPTPEPPSKPPARPQPLPATAQAPEIPRPSRDVPYVSDDTGTIAPGMSETDVYSLWGPPAAVRHSGQYTYLYFRNACEYSCGMLDLVTLQNGQVVDAVLRWDGHRYSGQSSSPKATKPHYTPGGDTLTVRPPSTP